MSHSIPPVSRRGGTYSPVQVDHSGSLFSLYDLFTVGTAFDLLGAWFLARGLLSSPVQLVRRSSTFVGMNVAMAVESAGEHVDGRFGVLAILGGFVMQAGGYCAYIAAAPHVHASGGRALVSIVLAVLAALIVFLGWRRWRMAATRRVLIEMA